MLTQDEAWEMEGVRILKAGQQCSREDAKVSTVVYRLDECHMFVFMSI